MKSLPILAKLAVLGAAGSLTSCVVDPYYPAHGSHTTTTVTHHRPGYVVNTLPPRYETVTVSGTRYYRHDNIYYRPQGNRYVVVEAPRGSRGWDDRRPGRPDRYDRRDVTVIRTLPPGARTIRHRGQDYYQSGNVYYQQRSGGYVIVERPR